MQNRGEVVKGLAKSKSGQEARAQAMSREEVPRREILMLTSERVSGLKERITLESFTQQLLLEITVPSRLETCLLHSRTGEEGRTIASCIPKLA